MRKAIGEDNKAVLALLIVAFVLRVTIAPFGTLRLDMNSWMGWASRLTSEPLARFYDQWSDYLPGYLYVLWALGQLQRVFGSYDLLFKLPGILADVGAGWLVYWVIKKLKVGEKWALLGAALYLFNPAVWVNSSLWGQVDGLSSLVVVASLVLLSRKRFFWSIVTLGLGFMIKPQIILLLPLAILYIWRERRYKTLMVSLAVAAGLVIMEFIPFWSGGFFLKFVWSRLWLSFNQYPYTSLNAFNLWGLSGGSGWWIEDGKIFIFGLPYRVLGPALLAVSTLTVLYTVWRKRGNAFRSLFLGGVIIAVFRLLFYDACSRETSSAGIGAFGDSGCWGKVA